MGKHHVSKRYEKPLIDGDNPLSLGYLIYLDFMTKIKTYFNLSAPDINEYIKFSIDSFLLQ